MHFRSSTHNKNYAAWADRKVKQLICTRGITAIQGDPSRRFRRMVVETEWGLENDRFYLDIPRPMIVQQFYSCFSTIDVHDHYRQGSLALERTWTTRTWWHRLLATLYGMIITDAYLAHRFEYRARHQGSDEGMFEFRDWMHRLAHQLINNTMGERPKRHRIAADVLDQDCNDQDHRLVALSTLPAYDRNSFQSGNTRAKRCCKICREKTGYFCLTCSSNLRTHNRDELVLVALCNPSTKTESKCLYDHKREVTFG